MLFLYGGSWSRGSASLGVYDFGHDAGHFQNMIGITINYRLELFGYAASEALRAEDPDGSAGNVGWLAF
jgi:carboxylesterase type B